MKAASQTFDLSRFGQCLRRDIALNGRGWLLRLLLLIAITTFLLYVGTKPIPWTYAKTYEQVQIDGSLVIFRFTAFLTFIIGASMFMENMTTPGDRLNSLMSPASTLEKYLCRITICVVGLAVAFVASFALAELLRYLLIQFWYGNADGLRYISISDLRDDSEPLYYLWGFLISAQATYVLGSTVFPKRSFLKTSGILIILGIASIFLATAAYNFTRAPHCFWPAEKSQSLILAIFKYAPLCWAAFCYITSYFRFKESEIIDRL